MNSRPKVTVALLEDDDVPTAFQVLSESFSHNAPLVNNLYPNHDTPAGRASGSERFLAWKLVGKDTTFLKAVLDSDSGEPSKIIGIAIWAHLAKPLPSYLGDIENLEKHWPDGENREFVVQLWKNFVYPRNQAITESNGKGVYALELLAIHPDYQRMGAGKALVDWGNKKADELRLQGVVEATSFGVPLYEKCGFHSQIEEMAFATDEKFNGRQKPKLTFLTREPET
ncbi:hypothetical protein BT63DRAFT_456862 [Microthyrium microscopicum]|uniref:N-acetyltransferase domain-containing protein n=1 Tax=Microthyrium microscopicum TaxID=703497 RepID=A0A6A6U7J3_9PEZI|nr:hypothetical protein BT63DRAFT_456862 [Microthyrium microscopicum]